MIVEPVFSFGCGCKSWRQSSSCPPGEVDTHFEFCPLHGAAPELLAACKAVMEFLSNGTPVRPGSLVQVQVFNAISKAEGRDR